MGWPGAVPGGRRQKARKSCSPSSESAPAAMARMSKGSRTCQARGASKRVGTLTLEDEVAVGAGPGRTTGVETGRGRGGRPDDHGGTDHGIHRPDQGDGVHRADHVGVDDLAGGMDAGVGATGAGQFDGLAQGGGQGPGQGAGHRGLPRLAAKPRNPEPS